MSELGHHLVQHLEVVDRAEMIGDQQRGGARLPEDVGELVGAVARVERDDDDPEAGARELRDVPQRTVGQPDAQPVALGEAERGQPGREDVDAREERAERDALVAEGDRLAVALAGGHGGQHPVGGRLREGARPHGYSRR